MPKDWQKNRYLKLFKDYNKADCELIILGGDIFDRIPTLEELELYFNCIKLLDTPTIIYSGNHEATKKGRTFLEMLKEPTKAINDKVTIQIGTQHYSEGFDIIPYEDLKKSFPEPKNPILFTHVRGEIPPHVVPEIDLELLDPWEIVFAGDLHSHTNCQRNIIYPGSPVTTSFHRNKVSTGYILLETSSLAWEFIPLELPQLLKETISSADDMVKTDYHHTIYELESEAGQVLDKDNELLDKVLYDKEFMPSLDLTSANNITQELDIYLKDIQKIKDTTEYIRLYNDYITET